MKQTAEARILALAHEVGVIRPRDLAALGLTRASLTSLVRQGLLTRDGRGLYTLASGETLTAHHSLVAAAKRVPSGVVCLVSALYFHDMGTQLPFKVWMAIHPKAHRPTNSSIRFMRFSGSALELGVETHVIEGVPVRIFSPAKTVVDCFRYRNKVGLDVALEALRDYLQKRLGTVDELWKLARACRILSVLRPYAEAMVA